MDFLMATSLVMAAAELLPIDPGSLVGGGGVAVGIWAVRIVGKVSARYAIESELRQRLYERQISALEAEDSHRKKESTMWDDVKAHQIREEEALTGILRAVET
jgi:hypothetical protein